MINKEIIHDVFINVENIYKFRNDILIKKAVVGESSFYAAKRKISSLGTIRNRFKQWDSNEFHTYSEFQIIKEIKFLTIDLRFLKLIMEADIRNLENVEILNNSLESLEAFALIYELANIE